MHKKYLICLVLIIFLLTACTKEDNSSENADSQNSISASDEQNPYTDTPVNTDDQNPWTD